MGSNPIRATELRGYCSVSLCASHSGRFSAVRATSLAAQLAWDFREEFATALKELRH